MKGRTILGLIALIASGMVAAKPEVVAPVICSFACPVPIAFNLAELQCKIACFRKTWLYDACELNAFARSIAPYFVGHTSHQLMCIVRAVFTVRDQALRWAISRAIPRVDATRLNMFWFMVFNPNIMYQPLEEDFQIVYNAMQILREGRKQNNLLKQRDVVERLGFFFENRTIDYISTLMFMALTPEDEYFLELMSLYLQPYEQLNMLVVWDNIMHPVKTIYNIMDEQEAQRAAEAKKSPQPPAIETASAAVVPVAQPAPSVTTVVESPAIVAKEAAPKSPGEKIEESTVEAVESPNGAPTENNEVAEEIKEEEREEHASLAPESIEEVSDNAHQQEAAAAIAPEAMEPAESSAEEIGGHKAVVTPEEIEKE